MIEKENINIDSLIIEDINIEDIIEHVETEHAGKGAHNIKSITYGGIDGIITTFAIMSAAIGANLSEKIIIIMGFPIFQKASASTQILILLKYLMK